MNIKILLLVLVLGVNSIQPKKHDEMMLCHFVGSENEFLGHLNTWINNTKHDLVIRWSLKDLQGEKFYTQEPILKRGDRLNIDYAPAIEHLKPAELFDFSIKLFRVTKHPKGAGQPLETKPLNASDMTLALHKKKFLKNDIFELRRNNNGLLVLNASKK